ncbi:MAG: 4a-hydroxytetrahydrobiopterin dehydratase [Candidatus Saccharibacteria bacterium]
MWLETNNKLYKQFKFKDFNEAFAFMEKVSVVCNELNHHPKWTNQWNVVDIWLSTHDKGEVVTNKDHNLAERIDGLLKNNAKIVTESELQLYTDGGSRGNPGPSASGFVVLNKDSEVIFSKGVYLGVMTNNQAEYLALKFGIEKLIEYKARNISIFMDSLLIINQMKGTFKIKNQDLLVIYREIKILLNNFDDIKFTHVPRELNKLADAEVNKALDKAIA